jgi:hypothetical protein
MSDSIVKVIIPLFVSALFAAASAAQSATQVAGVDDFLKAVFFTIVLTRFRKTPAR